MNKVLAQLRSLWRSLMGRAELGREMDEEFQTHIEMRTEHLIREGMDPKEAARKARLEFGSTERYREEGREARGLRWSDELLNDLRFASRSLRGNLGFSSAALITLALGIGASTAMFSVVDAVLLRPLDLPEPDRIVVLHELTPRAEENPTSPANFHDWREDTRSFESLAAWADGQRILTGSGAPEELTTRLVTGEYFSILGIQPLLGRTFASGDEEGSAVVLSHSMWVNRFGADPSVIGQSIVLSEESFTVVGVMPQDVPSIFGQPEMFAPLNVDPNWGGRFMRVIGRLAPEVPLSQARMEMDQVAERLSEAYPASNKDWGVRVETLKEAMAGDVRPALMVLLAAVGVLLIIACANVANLLLSRATTREREIAVRQALGASRGRIVRQLLTESLLLGALAGALGILVAMGVVSLLLSQMPTDVALPRAEGIGLDLRVLGFAGGLALLTTLAFGLVPALLASSGSGSTLRQSRGTTTGQGRGRLRSGLVVAEVALALMLLVGAGLLGRSFHQLATVDTGLDIDQIAEIRVAARAARYQEPAVLVDFSERLLERLEQVPGVEAAGIIGPWLPLSGNKSGMHFVRDDLPPPAVGEEPTADIRLVAGDYFTAAGIGLQQGRYLGPTDADADQDRVVVNEALSRRYFGGEDPVGKRITFEWYDTLHAEIVGVVGNVHEAGPAADPSPAIYIPFGKRPDDLFHVMVRTAGAPRAAVGDLMAAASSVDPNQPFTVRPMAAVAREAVARPTLNLILLGSFSVIAIVLAAIGLYGVISYTVRQRQQEIGVRVALGADRSDVVALVLGQGMRLAALGILLGLGGAILGTRLMTSMLFGVEPMDEITLAGVTLFLVTVAVLATYLPARRATRVDPVDALTS